MAAGTLTERTIIRRTTARRSRLRQLRSAAVRVLDRLASAGGLGPVGWGLLAIAVLWYWGLVWSLNPLGTAQASLLPHPEGAQYLDAAVNLVEGRGAGLHLAGQTLPSRFPPGYSTVLAPAILAGVPPVAAPFLVNKVAGLLLIVSVFLVAARAGGPAAGLASLLLVTRSSFVVLARSPLAEIVTALLVLWGAVLLYDYARRRPRWRGAAGVLLLAAAATCRLAVLPLLALAPLAWWLREDLMGRDRRRDLALGVGLAAAGLAPLLVYNTALFGAPWRTGYGFWVTGGWGLFSVGAIPANLTLLWGELTQARGASAAALYGEGSLLAPAYVVLLLLALEPLLRRRTLRWFAAGAGVYAAALLGCAAPTPRLLFPLIVLSAPPVAAATLGRMTELYRQRRRVPLAASALLLAVAVVGWPGSRSRTDLSDLARSHPLGRATPDYDGVVVAQAHAAGRPWLLLTDSDPTYAHAVTAGDRITAPAGDDHGYRDRLHRFSFGPAERQRLVAEALRSGRQVFAATVTMPVGQLPAPAGYSWEVVMRHPASPGGVARLVEDVQPPG